MDESLLQRYISQQSAVWKALLDKRESLTAPFAVLEPKPDRVILIGSGSSHYAALMARPVLEQAFGVEVSCFVPSQEEQLIRCRAAHPLYIAVSQSGISTNTYTLIRSLRAQGYPVVALTEHLDSPVGGVAGHSTAHRRGAYRRQNQGGHCHGVDADAAGAFRLPR